MVNHPNRSKAERDISKEIAELRALATCVRSEIGDQIGNVCNRLEGKPPLDQFLAHPMRGEYRRSASHIFYEWRPAAEYAWSQIIIDQAYATFRATKPAFKTVFGGIDRE